MRRGGQKAIWAIGFCCAMLAGCASATPRNAPDWFRAAQAHEEHGYPNLRDVPHTVTANTNAQHWAEVQTDLAAAKQELRASPRAEPAAPQDPNGFVNDARAAIDATRATHPDK